MSALGRLGARVSDVSRWRDGDKCALASALTLPFVVVWALRLVLVRLEPSQGAYLVPSALGPMLGFVLLQGAVHLVVVAAGRLAARRGPRHPTLVAITIQLWFGFFFLDLWAIGPYTSPFGMLLLVFPPLGFIVFGVRPVAWGVASFAALLALATVAERLAWIEYAPLIVDAPLPDGRPHTAWILSLGVVPLVASAVILAFFAMVVIQWQEREERLEELCRTDYLTGVENRRSFMERAEVEFARSRRYGKALALVMVDVDHFKQVNDVHGHGVGDEVLKLVARILADEVRRHDVVARYGGEEFSILLAETEPEQARVMAERCRARIESTGLVMNRSNVRVTASVGVAAGPRGDTDRIGRLIDRADAALYEAKASGRNRVAVAA